MRLTADDFAMMYEQRAGMVHVWLNGEEVSERCYAFDIDAQYVDVCTGIDREGKQIYDRVFGDVRCKVERFEIQERQ